MREGEDAIMVGIFGCLLKEGNAAPVVHEALKRREYRGYDSVDEVTIHEGRLYVKKRPTLSPLGFSEHTTRAKYVGESHYLKIGVIRIWL